MNGRYVVLVEYLAREGRPFPRSHRRLVIAAMSSSDAAEKAVKRSEIASMGDLLVSLTVGPVGLTRKA